ncbi:MAG: hypothetical protein MZV49_23970 [Rhodopseudomonas palustris]|nr:hypothetical protein [Rhodopseudomonas palustris]
MRSWTGRHSSTQAEETSAARDNVIADGGLQARREGAEAPGSNAASRRPASISSST